MIVAISPDAPPIVHAAAAAVLYLHIVGGFVGMGSGFVAMASRKGGRIHRISGNVFFGSMLVMAGIGAATAPLLPQRIASVAGLLTFYLVATAWVTIRRAPGRSGRFEIVGLVMALVTAAWGFVLGWTALNSPGGELEGLPGQPAIVFAVVATLAAAADLRVIVARGLSGPARLARHIWRMSLALLLATTSFLAQPAAIPDAIEGSPLLFAPVVAVLALTLYWLVRIRLPGALRRRARTAPAVQATAR